MPHILYVKKVSKICNQSSQSGFKLVKTCTEVKATYYTTPKQSGQNAKPVDINYQFYTLNERMKSNLARDIQKLNGQVLAKFRNDTDI